MQEQKFTGCPPIDKLRLKYYGDKAVDAPSPERAVYERLRQSASS